MQDTRTLLLKAEEVADELRMSRATVYELIAKGDLKSVKIGRARRVARVEVERYVSALTDSIEAGGAA